MKTLEKLAVGKVDYLNCFPVYYPIEQGILDLPLILHRGAPAQLNKAYSQGELAITPISSIEYIRNWDNSLIMPNMSISAMGQVESIILFSRVPIENLHGKKIALTSSSATSVVLLRIILAKLVQIHPEYVTASPNLEEMMTNCDAAFLIGDDALTGMWQEHDYYAYDMGEMWYELTGLPMVYALWVIKQQVVEEQRDLAERIRTGFLQAKHYSATERKHLLEQACQVYPYRRRAIDHYFDTIKYELTQPYLEGLRLFFTMAEELGAIPRQVDLNIWN